MRAHFTSICQGKQTWDRTTCWTNTGQTWGVVTVFERVDECVCVCCGRRLVLLQTEQMQKDTCVEGIRGTQWAFMGNNLPSVLVKWSVGTRFQHTLAQFKWRAHTVNIFWFACLSWLCFSAGCWNPLKVILFISEGVSKTCCSTSVCHQHWDATDSSGYTWISLWNSYIQ